MNRKILIKNFIRKAVGELALENNGAPWLEQVEQDTGLKYPPSFTALVQSYAFPSFEIDDIEFMANSGNNDENDIQNAIHRDQILFRALFKHNFLQFGRPSDGSYDPICFNANIKAHNREYEIVRLDHEALLMYERQVIKYVIAHSFVEFMEKYLNNSL